MALTISLQFPTGRYVAASWSDKGAVEWPPHPARLCLGLVDALHCRGNRPGERAALEWLCAQGAPEIALPCGAEETAQTGEGVFVPQNRHDKKTGEVHPRKERSFPAIHLDPDQLSVFFRWPRATGGEAHAASLGELLASLPRFGHSSSLVIASLGGAPAGEGWQVWEPVESDGATTPECQLRVPWDGIVASAEASYQAGERERELDGLIAAAGGKMRSKSTLSPRASPRGRHDPVHRWSGYRQEVGGRAVGTPWGAQVLLLQQSGGGRLGIEGTWQVTETLHKAILDRWGRAYPDDPIPAWVSGHAAAGEGGGPARHCHLALFPLPFVGREHADGHMLGIGMALPRPGEIGLSAGEQRADWRRVLAALLGETGALQLTPRGGSWNIALEPVSAPQPPWTLSPHRWTRTSTTWETVTPAILHRHPKPHFKKDPAGWRASCEGILRAACTQLGLPEPLAVEPTVVSPVAGVPPSGQFVAPAQRRGRPARYHLHARFHFGVAVEGPLLVGAGRYRGYGLCVPCDREGGHAS